LTGLVPGSNSVQVVHTCASVTKQYNLVLAKGWRCSAAKKLTTSWRKVMPAYQQLDEFWTPHL